MVCAFVWSGCPHTPEMPSADASLVWADRQVEDGSAGDDAALDDGGADFDAARPDAALPDAGPLPTDHSVEAPATEIVRTGAGGLLLRGTILTPGGPLVGEVLVVADTIQCVAASCSDHPLASGVSIIDTHATISPGLIDGHNHATYDFLPEWTPGTLFDSRYEWRSNADYSAHIAPESDGGSSGTLVCPATKWAELRSIVHGTTTIQGQSPRQSCVDRLARNADHYHGLGGTSTAFGTSIAGPCEGTVGSSTATAMNDTWRAARIADWLSGDTTRLAVHMAEGTHGSGATRTNVLREFDCYLGRASGGSSGDHQTNLLYDEATNTPYGTSYLIHSTGLTPAELDEAHTWGAYFVWSPSSNLALYDGTTDIAHLIEIGATVGLGPDWTVSGTGEMLSEMRFAYAYGQGSGIATLTPERIVRMATQDGARAVDLEEHIGTIEVGHRADLVVFGRVAADPYRAVIESRSEDIRLVLIDGLGYYGELGLEGVAAVNGSCEDFDACGSAKFLCVANTPGSTSRADETYESIRSQLYSILENGYTGGTAYGRGSELRELVRCE